MHEECVRKKEIKIFFYNIMNILFRTKCNKQCKHKWKNTNQCSETKAKAI